MYSSPRKLLLVFMTFLIASSALSPMIFAQDDRYTPDYSEANIEATGDNGMVVSAHPLASQVGLEVLENGGNAIDAAIAMQFALTVVEPMMSGIGGGGFMMVYDAETGETTIVNSRERAPAGADPEMFLDEDGEPLPFQERVMSGNSVGVPGTLRGLETAHEMWGTVDFSELIEPAIYLAENGFPIDDYLSEMIESSSEKLLASPGSEAIFFVDGEPLAEGDMLVQADLSATLQMISDEGADVYFNGDIAEAIAATVQEFGGTMTADDLANYDVTVDEPIWGQYKGYDIASMPPPSSGGIFLLQMLEMMEYFDLEAYDFDSVEKYHIMSEVMHLAYADRGMYAGDPEFVEVPVEGLLDPAYIEERANLIDLESMMEEPEAGDPTVFEDVALNYDLFAKVDDKAIGETTHFTVADGEGNVVSYTTTIEQVFGSGITVDGYGILLNNELTDFDAEPGGANEVQPNKRPLSSMTPTIVFENGMPVLTVGSPGGPTIITSVFQTILNVFEYDMELREAIEAPRIYTNNVDSYRFEEGISEDVLDGLRELGHGFDEPVGIGNVNSILIDINAGEFYGVADTSRNGAAFAVNGGNGEADDVEEDVEEDVDAEEDMDEDVDADVEEDEDSDN